MCISTLFSYGYAGMDFKEEAPQEEAPPAEIMAETIAEPEIDPIMRNKILVEIDYTEGYTISAPASQIVIGNPLIADIKVRDDEKLFIIGKSPGRTNMLIYGQDGTLIERNTVIVRDPAIYVKLYNGASNAEHYDCVPYCQRVVRITDEGTAFQQQIGQITTYNQAVNQLAQEAIVADQQASSTAEQQ